MKPSRSLDGVNSRAGRAAYLPFAEEHTAFAPAHSQHDEASNAARGFAADARRFDAALSDADVAAIARGIDAARSAAAAMNAAPARALANGDDLVARFAAGGGRS